MVPLLLALVALVALATIAVALGFTIASDGYGLRPPPRSHRAEEEFDSWGLPIRHLRSRS